MAKCTVILEMCTVVYIRVYSRVLYSIVQLCTAVINQETSRDQQGPTGRNSVLRWKDRQNNKCTC